MPTFNQDIREIRQTVYGRDMREPIADAILKLNTSGRPVITDRPIHADAVLDDSIVDWIEYRPRTVYVSYEAASNDTTSMSVSVIESDDYLLSDFRVNDSIVLLKNDDYQVNLGDSRWTSTEMIDGSYIAYDRIEHKETYVLEFEMA